MSNLSILDHNIIHSLEAYDCAEECEDIYLRHRHLGPLNAERMADRWGMVGDRLTPMLEAARRIAGCDDNGVRDFIRVRFENFSPSRDVMGDRS
jgi:hypothetical protein